MPRFLTQLSGALVLAALALFTPNATADAHSDALAEADRLDKEVERLYAANRYPEALEAAKKELAIREKELGPDDAKTASAASDVGALYLASGDILSAEKLLTRAVAAFEKATARDDSEYATALNNLASVYVEKNQSSVGRPYMQRAVDVMEKATKPNQSLLATYYAALAAMTPDLDQASKLFEKAIAIHEKVGPIRSLISDLTRFAKFKRANARPGADSIYQRALDLALKSLGPADKLTAELRRNFGRSFWGAGVSGHADGERLYKDGYDALVAAVGPNHPEVADLMQDWAIMKQIEGDLEGSLDLRRRADVIEERTLDRMLEAGTESDRLDYAQKLYKRVDFAVELALSLGKAKKSQAARRYALEMVLKRKGQVLDAMTGGIAALRAHASPEEQKLLADLAGVRGDLAKVTIAGAGDDLPAYRAHVAALESKENELEAKVGERSAAYRAAKKPVTLDAVQAALPEGSVLIELFRWNAVWAGGLKEGLTDGERYVAFIVQKHNDPFPIILADADEVDQVVHQFRNAIASPDNKRVYEISERLNHFLLLRLEAAFDGAKSLFIAPDSELNLVPFAALLDSKQDFMVRKYAITYLSSGRDLMRFSEHRPSVDGPTIFANPRYDENAAAPDRAGSRGLSSEDLSRMHFPPLPGTQAEAEAIGKVIPDAKVHTGTDATEGAIKAVHSPSVLHVATHGFFLSAAPIASKKRTRGLELDAEAPAAPKAKGVRVENPLLRSGLAFSGANTRHSGDEDGVLTALEASDLDLEGTKLVVLSACETGVGDVKRGQGVFSLRRALVEAGAETQVMSLWEVDDDATKTLMSGYYAKLFAEGKGRSEALREVQIAMVDKKETEHPFYWAAFIVSGDPSPIVSAATSSARAGTAGVPKVEPGARGCGCATPTGEPGLSALAWLGFAAMVAGLRRSRRQ